MDMAFTRPRTGLLIASMLVAACQAPGPTVAPAPSTGPSPTAAAAATEPPRTATPSAAPTARPDVAAAFSAAYSAATSGTIRHEGTATIGDEVRSFTAVQDFTSSSRHVVLTAIRSGTTATTERTQIGDERWVRTGDGPWFIDAAPSTSEGAALTSAMRSAFASLVDRGPGSFKGVPGRRLEPEASVTMAPGMFAIAADPKAAVTSTVTCYARDDGTPLGAEIEMTWTSPRGSKHPGGSLRVVMDLTGLGKVPLISRPRDIWVRYTSRDFGYTLGHPEPWFENPGEDQDEFRVVSTGVGGTDIFLGGSRLIVGRYSLAGTNLAGAVKAVSKARRGELGCTATTEKLVVAGEPAVMITCAGGTLPMAAYDVVVVRGKTFYDILWVSDMSGLVMDEKAVFRQLLTTFAFA